MAKYLDLSAHHEVSLDELLGKKAQTKEEKDITEDKKPVSKTEVKQE